MSWIQNNSLVKVLLLSFIIIVAYLIMTKNDVTYGTVEVQEGDTLWTLAHKYKGSMSTSDWIESVKKENNLSNDKIIAGDQLSIPIPSESIHIAKNDEDNEKIYVKIASNE